MKSPERNSRGTPLLERTQALMRQAGIKARKKLGQHFLVDEAVLTLILETAGLTGTETVIEVGPGPGILTKELCSQAGRVAAVELDDALAAALQKNLADCGNLTVLNRDILEIAPEEILQEAGAKVSSAYRVVANLPYYITSPVLRHFLEAGHKPEMMVVMVQKEVAEEIAARPGKMSLLSIGIQLYGVSEIIGYVPAACFYPEPKVDSAIVKIVPHVPPPVEIADIEGFFSLARAGFSLARKQLGNSLANGLRIPKEEARRLLEQAGIDARRRAETLTIPEWAELWNAWSRDK